MTWNRSEEHTSELQSHRDLHSFPTRRSSDLVEQLEHAAGLLRYDLVVDRPGPGALFAGVWVDDLEPEIEEPRGIERQRATLERLSFGLFIAEEMDNPITILPAL